MTIHPRFDVTPAQIDAVVASFYALVRKDSELGPVFASHVTDWPSHEQKIARFWRNAILGERSYDGNPMQKHMQAGNVAPEHFAGWLTLFDQVLTAELPGPVARDWSALVHRIGHGLRSGLLFRQGRFGAVPDLG